MGTRLLDLNYEQRCVFIAIVKAKMKENDIDFKKLSRMTNYSESYLRIKGLSHDMSKTLILTYVDIFNIDLDYILNQKVWQKGVFLNGERNYNSWKCRTGGIL